MTARTRRPREIPSKTNRSSSIECRGSPAMRPSGSPKTVPASSNDTPCLARFLAAFCGSHSNLSTTRYYSHAHKTCPAIPSHHCPFPIATVTSYSGKATIWFRTAVFPQLRKRWPVARAERTQASQAESRFRSRRDCQICREYLRGGGIRRSTIAGLLASHRDLDRSRRRKLARRQREFHEFLFTRPECDSLEPF